MKNSRLSLIAVIACVLLVPLAGCDLFNNVQSNVPERRYFHDLMIRDLRAYFKLESDSKTSVGYELLEDGTYGGGKSFPHYCVWVYIYDGNKVLEQGIAAVAAENKQRFDVTKYISKEEIKKNPKAVAETFPPILCPEIIDRAKRP